MNEKTDIPRYMEAMMKLVGSKPGQIIHTNVQHDDWCAIWKDKPCNCDFDISQSVVTESDA